jgi:hypothetical protein
MTGSKGEQDEAAKKLAEFGTIAVPALRKYRTDANADAAKRVRECLEKIEELGDKPLARPAMRRLLIRRPAGTAEAMLGYLPFASDPAAEEDIYYGLDSLCEKDPKTLTVLATALKDVQPSRRAVTACILGRRGNAEQKQAVRDLLKDADSLVRLRAAQGLLAGKDTSGVQTLIDLLTDQSIEICWQAEELLRWVSNETAPDVVVAATGPGEAEAQARSKCQAAWRNWAKEHAAKIDFAALEQEPRRPLLLLGYDRAKGRVWIFGSDGVTRCEWQLKPNLADAQYVPGGTVLTLHEQPVREKPLLAERDRAGKVLWQYEDMRDPASIQRLSDGRVFVAERQSVEPKFWYTILAASGKKLASQPDNPKGVQWTVSLRYLPDGGILGGWTGKLPGGRGVISLNVFDPITNDAHRLPRCGDVGSIDDRLQVEETPDGFLCSRLEAKLSAQREIFERAPDGHGIWWFRLPRTTHAARLRDGNTIASLPNRLIEISLDKRTVADIPFDTAPTVARPCLQLVRLGFRSRMGEFDLATSVEARVRALASRQVDRRRFALGRLAEL